jgi:TonB family protein
MRLPAFCAIVAALSTIAAAGPPLTLAGVTLGETVTDVVSTYGPPGLVETTDQGHEWRWFDAKGIDVDLLTDDSMSVQQILVGRPEPLGGKVSPLVQPDTFAFLEAPPANADAAMHRLGGVRIAEPNSAVSVWRLSGDYVVFELQGQTVRKILALDAPAAARSGYVGPGQPFNAFRAPRLLHQYAVDYPKRAVLEHAAGVVVVRADVSAGGTVTSVTVVVSSGNQDIDNAELTSIRKSTFRPAQCSGQPCGGVYLDREEYTLGD